MALIPLLVICYLDQTLHCGRLKPQLLMGSLAQVTSHRPFKLFVCREFKCTPGDVIC